MGKIRKDNICRWELIDIFIPCSDLEKTFSNIRKVLGDQEITYKILNGKYFTKETKCPFCNKNIQRLDIRYF